MDIWKMDSWRIERFFLQRGRGKEDNTSRQYSRILLRTFLTRTFFEHSGTATGNLHRLAIT